MSNYTDAKQNAKLRQARALLAKAESTNFPEEAAELSAKASQLIAEYGLDAAKVYAADHSSDELVVVEIVIQGAYALRQMALLSNIADPLRVRAVRWGKGNLIKLFGFRSDVERTQLLFTSLLLQARSAVEKAKVPSYEHGRTFRTSFYNSFIVTVRDRLIEIEAAAQADEAEESGSNSTALVLVDRKAQVDLFLKTTAGKVTSSSSRSRTSHSGAQAGRQAGNRADLGQTRVNGRRTAINA